MISKFALYVTLLLLSWSAGVFSSLIAAESGLEMKEDPNWAEAMTLQQALSRVFESSPELEVSELEVEAASARIIQAGLRPNPELAAEGENFPTMSSTGAFRYLESTLKMSQRFELGGKRDLRIQTAKTYKSLTGYRADIKKAELIAATARAFADVLADQERLSNQQELTRLARQSHSIVLDRVNAGKVSPVEQTRAEVALASAQLEEEKQLRSLFAAKDRLAALWGGSLQDFERVEGHFEIPPESTSQAQSCPDLELADASIDFRRENLASEQAAGKPDVTLSAGFRHLKMESQNAWVFSVSLPLPIFDKQQGAIAEAKILLNKATSEKIALEWHLRAALIQARHEREMALLEANTLIQRALPAARNAMSAIEEGYRLGKFEYMNVLDAQRTYAELQRQYIEAVASGLKAAVEINRLAYCDSQANPPVRRSNDREIYNEK